MLFSNAGAMSQGSDAAGYEQNFRLDVLGAVNAFEAARPFLEASGAKNGDASVVIISSVSAAIADNTSSYGPIKAALIHMAKGLARQYARQENPRQRGVARHGLFQGRRLAQARTGDAEDLSRARSTRNPLGRMATPQDVANAAVFLASPASSFTTGSNLIVDGAISNRVNF